MRTSLAVLILLPLLTVGYVIHSSDNSAYPHSVIVKRVNNEEPAISSQISSTYGGSTFYYNYNAAFVPDPTNDDEGGLLVRCQNITGDSEYSVGPSVITYVKLASTLQQLDNIQFEHISDANIVIQPDGPETTYGTEDPRVVYNPADKLYYVLFSAVENATDGSAISRLALSTTPDPANAKSYTYHGPIFPQISWSKSGALLIRDSGLSFLYWGDSSLVPGMQLATTSDLIHYTYIDDVWLPIRNDSFDSLLVEAGPMPLPLSDGNYIMLYNSARHGYPSDKPNWDVQYNVGYVILDKNDPTKILYRSDEPIMSPELMWEIGEAPYLGLTPNVVFIEGWVPHPTNKDTFIAFYGGADSVVGAAEITVEI